MSLAKEIEKKERFQIGELLIYIKSCYVHDDKLYLLMVIFIMKLNFIMKFW